MILLHTRILENLIDPKDIPEGMDVYSFYMQGVMLIWGNITKRYVGATTLSKEELEKIIKDDKYYDEHPEEFMIDALKVIESIPTQYQKYYQQRLNLALDEYNRTLIITYLKKKNKQELAEFQKAIEEFMQSQEKMIQIIDKLAKEDEEEYTTQILLNQLAQGKLPDELKQKPKQKSKPKQTEPKKPKKQIDKKPEELEQLEQIVQESQKDKPASSTTTKPKEEQQSDPAENQEQKPQASKPTDKEPDNMPINLTSV